MKTPWRKVLFLVVAVAVGMLAGCHADPIKRRQRYLDSGTKYFAQQKYREAAIQFENAIQADPKYAESHYELARCLLELNIEVDAYQELKKAINLDGTFWKAHLELGAFLMRHQQLQEAEDEARKVLIA